MRSARRISAWLCRPPRLLKPTQLDQMTERSMWAETPCPEARPRGHEPPASTSVVRNYGSSRCRSDRLLIVRRRLARILSIGNNVESDLLSLVEGTHASAFDRADVHEDLLAAIIRLYEAKASLVIEELHGSLRHMTVLSGTCVMRPHVSAASSFEIWRKVVSPTRGVRRGQVVRPKLDRRYMGLLSWAARFAGKSLEKRLAIWPTSTHVSAACCHMG